MKQSQLFTKTFREAPSEEVSASARLLEQAGYTKKLMAGVTSYLPLGLRTLDRINAIIREEMSALGAEEMKMPALHPKSIWEKTGRWDSQNIMYRLKDRSGKEIGLGWTHEEVVADIAASFIHSYKDLPRAVYQIQEKFRDEPRAKAGLLRGREFLMKDLYSFSATQEQFEDFYRRAQTAYANVFRRCGLDALIVEASGGAFSKRSHEFQVITPAGEDTVFWCPACGFAQNEEIFSGGGQSCPKCSSSLRKEKSIEVGNIFPLGTRFSEAFGLYYHDRDGERKPVIMGSYGIGPGRVLATIVEVHHDGSGIIWPLPVAPFDAHLLLIDAHERAAADAIYAQLDAGGVRVLYDDRDDASAGEKFADADLIGIPFRLVVSARSAAEKKIALKKRGEDKEALITTEDLLKKFSARHVR